VKFKLEIELGDGHDQPLTLIVSSLRDVAQTVQSQGILFAQTRAIHNHHGNVSGEWEITDDESPAINPDDPFNFIAHGLCGPNEGEL
jgi:hypothetical protein